MSKSSGPIPCPSCGTPSTGKFCAECGSALFGAKCPACETLLTPGARFCHRCGAGVGAGAASPRNPASVGPTPATRSVLPWAIGTLATLALVIAVAVQQSDSASPAASGPNIPLDGSGAAGAPFAGEAPSGVVRGPDISSMSPRERADRLYNRVMRLASEGKSDSAAFFASMATQAYEMLEPSDNDVKYDYGRMAHMSGNFDVAQKQSESILASNPDHLLGLILGAVVAESKKDPAARNRLYKKFLTAEPIERAKSVEEYERHKGDIEAALVTAKSIK